MKIESKILSRIIKNALLSLLIYALPIVLMLTVFYIKGERPWIKTDKQTWQHHQK